MCKRVICLTILVMVCLAGSAMAKHWYSGAAAAANGPYWDEPYNWSWNANTLPTATDDVCIYMTAWPGKPCVVRTAAVGAYLAINNNTAGVAMMNVVSGANLAVNRLALGALAAAGGADSRGHVLQTGGTVSSTGTGATDGVQLRAWGTGLSSYVMTGGTLNTTKLVINFGSTSTGTGHFQLDGGTVNTDYIWIRPTHATTGAQGTMDIKAGVMYVAEVDDQYAFATALQGNVDNDLLTGYSTGQNIRMSSYETSPGSRVYETMVWAVPEPATVLLLGLGGLALIRKRR